MEIKTYAVVLATNGKVAEINTFPFDADGRAEARRLFEGRCSKDLELEEHEIPSEDFYEDGDCSVILTETGNMEEGGVVTPPVAESPTYDEEVEAELHK